MVQLHRFAVGAQDFAVRVSVTVYDTNGVPLFTTEPVLVSSLPDDAEGAARKLIDQAENDAVARGYTPVDFNVDSSSRFGRPVVSVYVAEEAN